MPVGVVFIEAYAGFAMKKIALDGHFYAAKFKIQGVEELCTVVIGAEAVNEQQVFRRAGLLPEYQLRPTTPAHSSFHGGRNVYAVAFGALAAAQAVEQHDESIFKGNGRGIPGFNIPHIGRSVAVFDLCYEPGAAAAVPYAKCPKRKTNQQDQGGTNEEVVAPVECRTRLFFGVNFQCLDVAGKRQFNLGQKALIGCRVGNGCLKDVCKKINGVGTPGVHGFHTEAVAGAWCCICRRSVL